MISVLRRVDAAAEAIAIPRLAAAGHVGGQALAQVVAILRRAPAGPLRTPYRGLTANLSRSVAALAGLPVGSGGL